jgi:hypothetical protein
LPSKLPIQVGAKIIGIFPVVFFFIIKSLKSLPSGYPGVGGLVHANSSDPVRVIFICQSLSVLLTIGIS